MAAPFSQPPTLGEFIRRAEHYGYILRATPRMTVTGARGVARIRYLVRNAPGVLVDLPDLNDDDWLTRDVLDSLCRRAGIPREDFSP